MMACDIRMLAWLFLAKVLQVLEDFFGQRLIALLLDSWTILKQVCHAHLRGSRYLFLQFRAVLHGFPPQVGAEHAQKLVTRVVELSDRVRCQRWLNVAALRRLTVFLLVKIFSRDLGSFRLSILRQMSHSCRIENR